MRFIVNHPSDLHRWRENILKKRPEKTIIVSNATCGRIKESDLLVERFRSHLQELKIENIRLRETGCLGYCEREPIVIIRPYGYFYPQPRPDDVKEIIEESVLKGRIIERLLLKDIKTNTPILKEEDVPFYKNQKRLLLNSNFEIDPTSIEDYISIGGYEGLITALTKLTPEEVISIIKRAKLRGRGGAGFPTGTKWEQCRRAEGDTKYIICNADEGDPGAYANRGLMEGNPHSIIEGMIIGAYAVGATKGYIYVRAEYPLAVKFLRKAIEDCRECGILGENILGTNLCFDIDINRGAGAFVCGESTALMSSLEGKAGEPRAKHIHATEKGLWNRPTTLNNVETWACVPLIINNGWEWFANMGTKNSTGTKIFSLVGKVNETGLVEVPMGITLKEIIYKVGGGIKNNKKFKGIQTGGPSGGILSERHLDEPIDYDGLVKLGSMMGSGGMIVMDEDTCLVDVARYYYRKFLQDESCGKCIPCREGLLHVGQILDNICLGKGKEGDIELLKDLGELLINASLCALGKTAPNPLLTTLEYFYDEYISHIKEKKCPAGVCKNLITYSIIPEKCSGCEVCKKNCPNSAIEGTVKQPHSIILDKCSKCGICYDICRFNAVVRN